MQICRSKDCVGCAACTNICSRGCIVMKKDNEGFEYPYVNEEQCIRCGRCKQVCPVMDGTLKTQEEKEVIKTYAVKNKDDQIREKSSSGGLFYLFARAVIKEKGVVVGAAFEEDRRVSHKLIDNLEDVAQIMGSKYMQSECGAIFMEIRNHLKEGQKVLFSGLPCQVAGLKTYLGEEYENLFCIDLVCHGVPSPAVYEAYLATLEDDMRVTDFRDKSTGWKQYSLRLRNKYNQEYTERWYENSYMRGFVNDLYLRRSCYRCHYKGALSLADITLGDFWGISRVNKAFDDDKGVSVVLVRTKKGEKLFQKQAPFIVSKEFTFEDAVKYNPSMVSSAKGADKRKEFFEFWKKEKFTELVNRITGERNR